MASIQVSDIPNGQRLECKGYVLEVTNDQRFFNVYSIDGHKPFATIVRPRVVGGNRFWECHMTNGHTVTKTAVGPRNAFARFIDAISK